MKFSLILILMVTVSVSYGKLEIKKRENYCYDSKAGFIKVGARIPVEPGKCYELKCAGTDQTSAVACPTSQLLPGSKCKMLPEDKSKSYPDCCERASCPK